MMYVLIIIGSIAAILLIVTNGFKGVTKNRTSDDRFSKYENNVPNDEGTYLGKTHTFFNWLIKPRHK